MARYSRFVLFCAPVIRFVCFLCILCICVFSVTNVRANYHTSHALLLCNGVLVSVWRINLIDCLIRWWHKVILCNCNNKQYCERISIQTLTVIFIAFTGYSISVFSHYGRKLHRFRDIINHCFAVVCLVKVIETGTNRQRLVDFLLVFHCNCVSILHRFWDIQYRIMSQAWNLKWRHSTDHVRLSVGIHCKHVPLGGRFPQILDLFHGLKIGVPCSGYLGETSIFFKNNDWPLITVLCGQSSNLHGKSTRFYDIQDVSARTVAVGWAPGLRSSDCCDSLHLGYGPTAGTPKFHRV